MPSFRPLLFLAFLALAGCKPATDAPSTLVQPHQYSYEVVHTYPHDPAAFTEGLVFLNGHLYESTGLNGQSSLREVDLDSGNVTHEITLPTQYFGEGIAVLGSKIYQLTWQNHTAFVYDLATFNQIGQFPVDGEGWGLTTDGQSLIMSDGSSEIRFLDPATFQVQRTIDVQQLGQPITELNELEYINGEIYANVWQTNSIVRIDPKTGNVLGVINLTGLLPDSERTPDADVLNGIAYDPVRDRLFVTGKKWPHLYEIRLKPLN